VKSSVPGEGPAGPLGFVKHRHVRLNALFIHQPVEHLSRTKARVGGETLGVKIEEVMSSRDHGSQLPDRSRSAVIVEVEASSAICQA
jgi:hypothetical protein